MLLNDGWRFAKLPVGSALEDVLSLPEENWQAVDIPHDWLIAQEDDLYESADGWYRRVLEAPNGADGKAWILGFDGVYMDCEVLLNRARVAEHHYGYTAFEVDLSGGLRTGANELLVHVRFRSPNSRWYSGAGIYRDVTLDILPFPHIRSHGLYAHAEPLPDGTWRVSVRAETTGESGATARDLTAGDPHRVASESVDPARENRDGSGVFASGTGLEGTSEIHYELTAPSGERVASATALPGETAVLRVDAPTLWSCDTPNLYTLEATFGAQVVTQRIGLRGTAFDPDRGFLLNGTPLKLHGVCLHHDLGALGAAFNAEAFRRQLRVMKDMGANALRTAHNPPAARALDICDEMGVLVIDEFADMWERPKTPYDYARFFPADWAADARRWVERDRNHPCVILWSIGNEILDTHVSPRGAEITAMLRDAVRRFDPMGNAAVTIGSNYMPWEGAQRCADLVKIAGYNYGEKYYAAHHAAHPDWVIYGSETGSILSSRGVYHFPMDATILSEEDLQCSALGNSMTSWGTQDMRRCLIDDLNNPYSMGQFLWSGIDYIGEPTPYHTRSCYFGMVDTAGFPKDFFYQVRALWNPAPMARVGVGWDWNDGQMIDVPVYTNGASCELFLNGSSLGRREVDLRVPEHSVPCWRVAFEPGELLAVAFDMDGHEIARDSRRSHGDSARLVLAAERATLRADGEDVAFVTVSAVDADGHPVENAADRAFVTVEGPARLLGLDNGDSADADGYKQDSRCLFSGKLLAMVGATDRPGEAIVRARAEGLEAAELKLRFDPAPARAGIGRTFHVPLHPTRATVRVPARRIDLRAMGERTLTPDHPAVEVRAALLPARADAQPIRYRIVNAAGIESACAMVESIEGGARVTGRGDGRAYLRAVCENGAGHARVISQLEIEMKGFGSACLDPYGFIAGGLCDVREGEITPGNDKGIAFARDGRSMAGFTHVDFGPVGSDEITMPVFALTSDPYEIALYMGDPREDGHLVARLPYQKETRWNVYQPETWKLPERFTGVRTVCFEMTAKIHLKGFSFAKQSRAWLPLKAGDADVVYGDSFTRDGGTVRDIGNNVSLRFEGMDFGVGGDAALEIEGATPLDVNPIQLRVHDTAGNMTVQECAFVRGAARQRFCVRVPAGECAVTFVFLPGCRFDFEGFRFERK